MIVECCDLCKKKCATTQMTKGYIGKVYRSNRKSTGEESVLWPMRGRNTCLYADVAELR